MMRLTKRVFSAFLAFVMVFTMLPLDAWAADGTSDNSLVAPLAVPNGPEAVGLELDQSSAVIQVGQEATFNPYLKMDDDSTEPATGCTWVSDHPEVAEVADGVVTGMSEGTATITCKLDNFETFAMVTVTEANYRLVYESNYPKDAVKYTYQNGGSASIGSATDTTVNETYEIGATAKVASGIFTTINYDLVGYLGSDGKAYDVGDTITMNSNLTLTAQWERIENANTTPTQIAVHYSGFNKSVYKIVNATVVEGSWNATVTFITANNQDSLDVSQDGFLGWTIGRNPYEFNQQVTTTTRDRRDWLEVGDNWYPDIWVVEATARNEWMDQNTAAAQFFIRKATASGYGDTDLYYSVGSGVIDTTDLPRRTGDNSIISAGSDNIESNVNDHIISAPSAAQIANLMNISLEDASTVRWYVIKDQSDGFHVDGVIYQKDKYWKVEFVDPDTNQVVQTLLVPDSERIDISEIMDGSRLDTGLREFRYWVDSHGSEANFNNVVTGDMQFTASFDRYSGYKVEYYLQNADDDDYTLERTDTEKAGVNQKVNVSPDAIIGYTLNEEDSITSGTVKEGETLVLKLYYDRIKYDVKYEYEGIPIPDGANRLLPKTTTYKHGSTVEVAEKPEVTGYEFIGWTVKTPSDVEITDEGTFTMPNQSVTLVGSWKQTVFTGAPITVEVIKDGEPVTASEYVDVYEYTGGGGTEAFKATPSGNDFQVTYKYNNLDCADITLSIKPDADITGYDVSVTSNSNPQTVGKVDLSQIATYKLTQVGDTWNLDNVSGGATITVTLKKLEYTVTYQPGEHGTLTEADADGNVVYLNVAYGENTPDAPEVNAEKGYYFTGWNPEIAETVTGNVVYTAQYAPQTAIIVKAKDLTKPYDGDALAADNTYELTEDLAEGHKLVVTTKVSKDVTNVTDEGGKHQIASVKVLDSNGDNVTYLYDITMLEGDLTITPITIILTSESKIWYYDGQPHSWPEVKIDGKFVEGEGFVTDADGKPLFTNFATVQNEGESKNNTFDYTLDSETTNSDNYDIQVTYGTISISNSYDVTYEFQGETPEGVNAPEGEMYLKPGDTHSVVEYPEAPAGYTFDGWYVGEEKYEPDQEITIVDQDITLVGKWTKLYKVTYDGNAPEGTTVDISGEAYQPAYYDDGYTVMLALAPAAPAGYTFDGWEIADSAAAITENSFTMPAQDVIVRATWTKRSDLSYTVNHYLVGTTLKVKESETVPNQVFGDNVPVTAGEVPDGYELRGNDTQTITIQVTENVVTFYYYKLATVKADDQEMTYGGTFPALTAAVTGLYGSDEATKITYNTPTTTATSTSPVGNYPIEVAGNEIQGYYKVTYVPGQLIIKPATMTLNAEGYDEVYDGAAHGGTVRDYPEGAKLLYSTNNGSTWEEKEPTVTDYTENPVTVQVKATLANYTDATATYTLNVKQRPVTLVSEGAKRPYNGQALTKANWHYEGEYGFVNGEVTNIRTIGTQTEIGSSKNTIAYDKSDGFKESNYQITIREGDLVVTPPQNPNEYDVVTKTHDKDNLNPDEFVTFTITVKNIFADAATVTLNELPGVSFRENGTNQLTFRLNGGETKEVEATYTITEEDVLAGKFVNKVSATLVVGDQTVEARATDTVTLEATPALAVKKTVKGDPANGETYALGETITWEIEVTNSGNVGLKNVSLTDTLKDDTNAFVDNLDLGEEANAFDLAAGSSKTFTVSYEVKESDLGKNLVNTATASAENPADPDGEPVQDEKQADPIPTDNLEPNLSVSKEADRTSAMVGETISYTITVTNNGNQTLNSIKVTDPLTGLEQTIAKLEPGDTSKAIPTTYTVQVSDLVKGKVTNIAKATVENGPTASGTAEVDVTGKLDISVNLASGKIPYDGEPHTVSGAATVKYGESSISVSDGKFTIGDTKFTLNFDEGKGTATETDVVRNPDGTVGSYLVTATPDDIKVTVDGSTTECLNITAVNSGTLTIEPATLTVTTESAEREYLVGTALTAEGNYTGLQNGETLTFEVTGKQEFVGSSKNTYTITWDGTAKDENYTIVENLGTLTVTAPASYDYVQKTHVSTGDDGNKLTFDVGDTITFQITVHNIYDKPATVTLTERLENVAFKDNVEGVTLIAGETKTFEATYTVTQADVIKGEINNTVDWTLTPENDQPITGEDKDEVTDLVYKPSLSVTKTVTSPAGTNGKYALGTTIEYQIVVKNDGNVDLTNIELEDVLKATSTDAEGQSVTIEKEPDGWADQTFDLKVGEEKSITASYKVTEADLGKTLQNFATATAENPKEGEEDVTGTGNTTGEKTDSPNPKLDVEKTVENADGTPFKLGETIRYKIVVTNTGNQTLTGINVTDEMTHKNGDGTLLTGGVLTNEDGSASDGKIAELVPAELVTEGHVNSVTFYYTYTVKESDLGKTLQNFATATAENPKEGEEDVTGTGKTPGEETDSPNPKLDVKKTVENAHEDGTPFKLGETIKYKIVVTNTGNVTLTGINVTDEMTHKNGDGTLLTGGVLTNEDGSASNGEIAELVPAELVTEGRVNSVTFYYTYTVKESDLGKTLVNVATATSGETEGENTPVEVTPDTRNPELKVVKTASTPKDGTDFALDETINYTITLTNTGNVTLYVSIRDLFGTRDDVSTMQEDITEKLICMDKDFDGTLKPEASVKYTYSYKVTEADLGKDIVNTVTYTAVDDTNVPAQQNEESVTEVTSQTDAPNPDLKVEKTVLNKEKAPFDLDETIHYQITVSNTGNVTLTNVSVEDVLKDSLGNTIESLDLTGAKNFSLAPKGHEGDSKTFNVSYTVKEEDLGKTLVNTVTAASGQTQPDPEDPNNDDHDETDGEKTEDPTPNMEVSKTVVGDKGSYRVGDVITYEITVKNTGNTTIHNIKLTDVMQASGDVKFTSLDGGKLENGVPVRDSLEPKTNWVVTCQYTVQLADAASDGTTIYNKVTVDAADGPDGNDPEAQTPGEDIDPIYTLTIKYQNGARVDLRDPDTVKLHAGDVYTVVAPGINGYHLSDKAYAEFDFTMRDRDTTIVIIYAANPVEEDDDEPVVNPDNDPDETTEETEDEVDPGVYIEDPDDYTLTPIEDDGTPLADMDVGEHTCCIMHFLLMLAAMVVLGFYTDSKKKHQARIFELKRTLAMEKGKNPDGDNSQQS